MLGDFGVVDRMSNDIITFYELAFVWFGLLAVFCLFFGCSGAIVEMILRLRK